jgi:tRNA U34 5-methylaminomethyl-2-thiouridine-forming methyltransferase MnmC
MRQTVVTADGSTTLLHPDHGESYHSRHGARTESTAVFLQNSGVLGRLEMSLCTRVLEIGFGTGFNFLLTAEAALRCGSALDYVAVEHDLITCAEMQALAQTNFPEHPALTENLINAANTFSLDASHDSVVVAEQVSFKLIIDDARHAEIDPAPFDAIYLDAFSPRNNPDLWQASFLGALRERLTGTGRLVSYCVSRQFRDGLTGAGFTWQKVPGPPGKREVLIAEPSFDGKKHP